MRKIRHTRCRRSALSRASACGVLFLTFVALTPATTRAVNLYKVDVTLLHTLQRMDWNDYADRQLQHMKQRYPDKKQALALEEIRMRAKTGQLDDALALIQDLPKDSPSYSRSLLILADGAVRRRRFKRARDLYAQFFDRHQQPVTGRDEDRTAFRNAVLQYAHVLKEADMTEKAVSVMNYLKESGETAISDRQMVYLQSRSVLDVQEDKFPDVSKKRIEDTLKKLDRLKYRLDGVAAGAYVEMARANVLLNKNEEAIALLETSGDLMQEIDAQLRRQGRAAASPLPGAFLYYGKALKGRARDAFKAKKRGQAKEFLREALKRFYVVSRKYPDSRYRSDALIEFGKAKNLLEGPLQTAVNLRAEAQSTVAELKLEEADAQFREERFSEALALYLTAFRSAPRRASGRTAAAKMMLCYGKLERFLEAQAVASYLEDIAPDAEETALSYLRLGAFLYQKAQAAPDESGRATFMRRARTAWDRFVELSPTHPKAPDIAFAIAETLYGRASKLASRSENAEGTTRKELQASARRLYRESIPEYERTFEQFGTYPKGMRALYKLGWAHYSLNEPHKAAAAFLKYAEREDRAEFRADRMRAVFRAAEQRMFNGDAKKAGEHLEALEKQLQDEEGVPADFLARMKEDTASYRAWSYDLQAEELNEQLTAVDHRISDAQQTMETVRSAISDCEKEQKQAAEDIEEARGAFNEREEQLRTFLPDLKKLYDGEKQSATEAEAQRVAGEIIRRELQRLEGERLEIEQKAKTTADELRRVLENQAKREARLDKTKQKLARLKTSQKDVEFELHEASSEVENAQRRLQQANEAARSARERVREMRTKWRKAGRSQRQEMLDDMRQAIRDVRRALAARQEARRARDETVTAEKQQTIAELRERKDELEQRLDATREQIEELKQEIEIGTKTRDVLDARRKALDLALNLNKKMTTYVSELKGEPGGLPERLSKLRSRTLDAFRTLKDEQIEKDVFIQNAAAECIAASRQRIETLQSALADMRQARQPVEVKHARLKRKAQTAFQAFLRVYPDSSHAPENMARLGSIHLAFDEFQEATRVLTRLADQYPDSKAGRNALFNLGRAQYEVGNTDAAAGTFKRMLSQAREQPGANLSFVAGRMLEAGQAKTALQASLVLLNRSENAERDDYEQVRENFRELALYRAGSAARQLGRYDRAVTFLEKLVQEYPNTGYFFDAKLELGQSRVALSPPDLEGALQDLSEIVLYAEDPVLTNLALVKQGNVYMEMGGEKNLRSAAARYQQVVRLADPDQEANKQHIEEALYKSAVVFKRLGKIEEHREMVGQYLDVFPEGNYVNAVRDLRSASQ